MQLTSNAEKRFENTRLQGLAQKTLVAYSRSAMDVRAALKNVTAYFLFLLFTATIGPLLFGYHLVMNSRSQLPHFIAH